MIALGVVALLTVLVVVSPLNDSPTPPRDTPIDPTRPGSSPPARVSSVFYVNGNLCPEVMTHEECKERLGE